VVFENFSRWQVGARTNCRGTTRRLHKTPTFLWIILGTQAVCVSEVFVQGVATCNAAPDSSNFASVVVGSASSQTFNVSNTGIAPVTILQTTVSGAGFGVSGPSLPLILTAGQSATFNAIFTPTASGSVAGSVSIISSATNSPTNVSLSGTGVTLLLSGSPTSTIFGNVLLGDHGAVVVTLTNVGTGSVTISQANVMGRELRGDSRRRQQKRKCVFQLAFWSRAIILRRASDLLRSRNHAVSTTTRKCPVTSGGQSLFFDGLSALPSTYIRREFLHGTISSANHQY
jgi:hypothetical protein